MYKLPLSKKLSYFCSRDLNVVNKKNTEQQFLGNNSFCSNYHFNFQQRFKATKKKVQCFFEAHHSNFP